MKPIVTEEMMREQIRVAARLGGWLWVHHRDSRRATPGWPDETLVRDGVMLALELKREGKYATVAQQTWIRELNRVPGIEARVVRPADMQELLERMVSRT